MVVLGCILLLPIVEAAVDLTFATQTIMIYESGSLEISSGTLICWAFITDNNANTVSCDSTGISANTQYRVEVTLKNVDSTTARMQGAGDYVDHENVLTGWAGSSPTLGSCAFDDPGEDDGDTTCNAAWSNTVDVRITNTGGGFVDIAQNEGEAFMYLITTDSDAVESSTSYFNANIDGNTEDSSKVSISLAAVVPEFSDYAILLILITVVGGFFAMKKKMDV